MAFNSRIEIEGNKDELLAYQNALTPEQDFGRERASYNLNLLFGVKKASSRDAKNPADFCHKLKQEKGKLVIEIRAGDSTAFRALLNSLAGAISVVEKSLKLC